MGISSKLKYQLTSFSEKQVKDIVKMAWNDNTSFEEIQRKFNIGPNELDKFMRVHLSEKDYKRWKTRVLSKKGRKNRKKKEIN